MCVRERERERECVCVCEREIERERERDVNEPLKKSEREQLFFEHAIIGARILKQYSRSYLNIQLITRLNNFAAAELLLIHFDFAKPIDTFDLDFLLNQSQKLLQMRFFNSAKTHFYKLKFI